MTKRNLFAALATLCVSAAFFSCSHALSGQSALPFLQQSASISIALPQELGDAMASYAASQTATSRQASSAAGIIRISLGGGITRVEDFAWSGGGRLSFTMGNLTAGATVTVNVSALVGGVKLYETKDPQMVTLAAGTNVANLTLMPVEAISVTDGSGNPLPTTTYNGNANTYVLGMDVSTLRVTLLESGTAYAGGDVTWSVSGSGQSEQKGSGGTYTFTVPNDSSAYTVTAVATVSGIPTTRTFSVLKLASSGNIALSDSITIGAGSSLAIAPGSGETVQINVPAGSDTPAFRVTAGGSLTLGGAGSVVIDGGETNGETNGSQSLIRVEGGTLAIGNNVTLQNSRLASGDGGALYITSGVVTMTGGTISGCKGTNYGGGVLVADGEFNMSGGIIENCEATYTSNATIGGGAVAVMGGNFTMSGSAIIRNNTARKGGGVQVDGGTFTMSGGTIEKNTAVGQSNSFGGGGVRVWSGTFILTGGAITNNQCTASGAWTPGGGIAVFSPDGSTFRYVNATISGNHTAAAGRGAPDDVFVQDGVRYATSVDGETRPLSVGITTVDGLKTPQYQTAQ